jgi:hypothetical protein
MIFYFMIYYGIVGYALKIKASLAFYDFFSKSGPCFELRQPRLFTDYQIQSQLHYNISLHAMKMIVIFVLIL